MSPFAQPARHARLIKRIVLGATLAALCLASFFLLREPALSDVPAATTPSAAVTVERGLDVEDLVVVPKLSPDVPAATDGDEAQSHAATGEVGTEDRWEDLKARADAGDLSASCELALRLRGCREASELNGRIEEALVIAAVRDDDDAAATLAQHEGDRLAAERRCGGIPTSVVLQEWAYLLRSAQAGHGPSMYRFVLDPPVDQTRPLEYLEAMDAYNRHAQAFIERLLASGSAEGLVAALILESGQPIIGMTSLSSGDPARRIQLAAALAILRSKPAVLESALSAVAGQLDTRAVQSAISAGERMSSAYAFRFADASVGVDVDDSDASCGASWMDAARTSRPG